MAANSMYDSCAGRSYKCKGISYEFDLQGPSYSVDTACSSSLYTVIQASDAIMNGHCDAALAGGVNLLLGPGTHIGFSSANMVSDRCKSFDDSANGYSLYMPGTHVLNLATRYARSEGAGMVYIKRMKDALEDGNKIYCVIKGGCMNNDGKTAGIAQVCNYPLCDGDLTFSSPTEMHRRQCCVAHASVSGLTQPMSPMWKLTEPAL